MGKNMSLPGAALAAQNNLPRIGELIEKIIRPLEQRKGIEAFQANLADACSGVLVGTLRDIREVEVVLTSTGRVSVTIMPELLIVYSLVLVEFPICRRLWKISRLPDCSMQHSYGLIGSDVA